jgi:AraC-like DNA-binding protein
MMIQRMYRPAAPLADFVDTIWYYEGYAPRHQMERVLPDGAMQLIVHLRGEPLRVYDQDGGPRLVHGPLVCGPRARYCLVDTAQQGALAGIHFRAGGAAPLLGVPASDVRDTHVALETLWRAAAWELQDRIVNASTPQARLGILEATLWARILSARAQHPAVAYAVRVFAALPRAASVADVAAATSLSHRRFIQVFREAVGLTPKTYCRVLRFQSALRAIARGERVEWAALAAQSGYYDQAHLVHDFRAFAGLAPSGYLARRGAHRNHVPLGNALDA